MTRPNSFAFIGLGVMGAPMARHLAAKSELSARVYNRTAAKAESWCKDNAPETSAFPTPAAAAADAGYIFICVGNDDDLRSVMYGDNGVLQGVKSGSIIVDHSTVSAEVARELAQECAKKEVAFIDAPVSGGQAGAENGALTVMCGGNQAAFAEVLPHINHFAKSCVLLGDSGAGQLAKMTNQICIAGVVQGLSEAIRFGEKAGLDMAQVIDVISKGAAQSWQMENRAKTMIDRKFDFGFAVEWMRKDLGICQDTARAIGASIPMTALVDQFYADLMQSGDSRSDTSSLIKRLS